MLKLTSLVLRFFQFSLSLVVVGGTGQVIGDIANRNADIPDRYATRASISGITAAWSGIALLITLCGGS